MRQHKKSDAQNRKGDSNSTEKESRKRHKQRKLEHIADQYFDNGLPRRLRTSRNSEAEFATFNETPTHASLHRTTDDGPLARPAASCGGTPGLLLKADEQILNAAQGSPLDMARFSDHPDVSYVAQVGNGFRPMTPRNDQSATTELEVPSPSEIFEGHSSWCANPITMNPFSMHFPETLMPMPTYPSYNSNQPIFTFPHYENPHIMYDTSANPAAPNEQADEDSGDPSVYITDAAPPVLYQRKPAMAPFDFNECEAVVTTPSDAFSPDFPNFEV